MVNIVIIGAGPAGRFAAMEAAEKGNNVTLIEQKHIGGKCLNQACMVVCALADISKHITESKNFNELGLIESTVEINYNTITKLIKDTQKKIHKIITAETAETGVELIQGTAKINNEKQVVTVNDDDYNYDKLLICTGSSPFIPNIPGAANAYTYKDILKFEEIPKKLIIIGGGSTAAEYAGIFSSFGSEVEVLCRSTFLKLLNDQESEEYIVSNLLNHTLIHENVEVKEITDTGVITNNGKIEGTVLLATGVTPNSEFVKSIIDLDEKGNIKVNKHMQTSDENIYAAGDVIGGILSTPVSRMEGITAIYNIMGETITPDYTKIPLTITLPYDVSYMTGTSVSKEGAEAMLPGAAGPNTFWNVLNKNTGFTKTYIDTTTGEINNILSISPASNIALPYMIKSIKDGKNASDFNNFLEIHPTQDGVFKLVKFFSRFL